MSVPCWCVGCGMNNERLCKKSKEKKGKNSSGQKAVSGQTLRRTCADLARPYSCWQNKLATIPYSYQSFFSASPGQRKTYLLFIRHNMLKLHTFLTEMLHTDLPELFPTAYRYVSKKEWKRHALMVHSFLVITYTASGMA